MDDVTQVWIFGIGWVIYLLAFFGWMGLHDAKRGIGDAKRRAEEQQERFERRLESQRQHFERMLEIQGRGLSRRLDLYERRLELRRR